jgi:L-ascorbate metabolism protein UlaG (beta-lactamase superfamily)
MRRTARLAFGRAGRLLMRDRPRRRCLVRVRKYGHSCLLVEERGEALLFDPGRSEFLDPLATPEAFAGVSIIALTHWHPDHADPEQIRSIVQASGATVLTTPEGEPELRSAGLEPMLVKPGELSLGAFRLQLSDAPHAPILGAAVPRNLAYLVNDRLLNVGDSFDPALERYRGVAVLALPITAPWLTELDAAAFAERLSPSRVLPVHDGYIKDFFRSRRYGTFRQVLEKRLARFETEVGPHIALEV